MHASILAVFDSFRRHSIYPDVSQGFFPFCRPDAVRAYQFGDCLLLKDLQESSSERMSETVHFKSVRCVGGGGSAVLLKSAEPICSLWPSGGFLCEQ